MAQTLSVQQSQRMALTPELRQAISILQLSTAELTQLINEAIDQNPLLEVSETSEDAADASTQISSFAGRGPLSIRNPGKEKNIRKVWPSIYCGKPAVFLSRIKKKVFLPGLSAH